MKFENIQSEIDNILDLDASEMTPEQQASVDAYLEELAGQEAGAVDGFARYIRMKIAMAAAKREEAQRLMQSARSDEGSANYLKMRFLQVMQARNLTRVKGNAYKVSIRSTPVVQILTKKRCLSSMSRQRQRPFLTSSRCATRSRAGQRSPGLLFRSPSRSKWHNVTLADGLRCCESDLTIK